MYEIRIIPELKNPHFGKGGAGSGDEFVGGHDEYFKKVKYKLTAHSLCKKLSKLEKVNNIKVHEIYLTHDADGFRTHWYFKKGKMTFTDKFEL